MYRQQSIVSESIQRVVGGVASRWMRCCAAAFAYLRCITANQESRSAQTMKHIANPSHERTPFGIVMRSTEAQQTYKAGLAAFSCDMPGRQSAILTTVRFLAILLPLQPGTALSFA